MFNILHENTQIKNLTQLNYIIIIFRSFICNYDRAMWLRDSTRDLHSGGPRFNPHGRQIWFIYLFFGFSYSHQGECRFGISFPIFPNIAFRCFNPCKVEIKKGKKDTSEQLTKSKPKQMFNLRWCICFLWIKNINFFNALIVVIFTVTMTEQQLVVKKELYSVSEGLQ